MDIYNHNELGVGETQLREYKSLDVFFGKKADLDQLAKECVAFANAQGGVLFIGIEDGAISPSSSQRIPEDVFNRALKGLHSRFYNVSVSYARIVTHSNGSWLYMVFCPLRMLIWMK